MDLSEDAVSSLLDEIKNKFEHRHQQFENRLMDNFSLVEKYIDHPISYEKKLLIGAYFSKEYSIDSAALFNPSIVSHPDQTGLEYRELRFILSLRAVSEGHISSVEFLTGVI